MKSLLQFIFIGLLVFGLAKAVFAYDLTLTKIGTMSTIGADYSLVSYVGSVPVLEGTATPAAMVSVKVNTLSSAVLAATTSGIWSFTPTSLSSGDNTITVTSGSQNLTFIIRYSATVTPTISTSTASSAVTTLPATGVWENVLYGVLAGMAIIGFGGWVKRKMRVWEHGR